MSGTHMVAMVVFAIIGLILLLQIVVIASSAISTRFRRRRPSFLPSALTRASSALIDQSEIRIFTYGNDVYEAMLDDIRAAKCTVFVESFIWKDDHIGNSLKQALREKARAGIAVFVIFDAFANLVVPAEFKRFPPEIHTYRYRAWRRLLDVLDPRRLARDHRKLLVVDHEIAYLGGYNIGDLYGAKWRDTHVRIEGPAARNLSLAFTDFWTEQADTAVRPPEAEPAGLQPDVRLYCNNPTRVSFPIRSMYIDAINVARDKIWLTTPYFIPDRHILTSLMRAAARGVEVQLIIPEQSNHLLADWLARSHFTDCLRHGIRVFLYQGAMIHAKTATIDGHWTTVGTANLDRLSLVGNHELNVEFFDHLVALQMEAIFEEDRTHCRELHLHEWERRPLAQKLGELVLSPYWPFL